MTKRNGKTHMREQRRNMPDKQQLFVVDDDKSAARALKLLLSTQGYWVDTFRNSPSKTGRVLFSDFRRGTGW